MKLYLDSCSISDIKKYYDKDSVCGITTTPTFAFKEKRNYDYNLINDIREIVGANADIYFTISSNNYDEILTRIDNISDYVVNNNIIFKLPICNDAIRATRKLKDLYIRTALHLVFSLNQAYLATKSEAENIFGLVGKTDDFNGNGLSLISDMQKAYTNEKIKIIASSVRNPLHVSELFKMGIYGITIPIPVYEKLIHHPLTDSVLKDFKKDDELSHHYSFSNY